MNRFYKTYNKNGWKSQFWNCRGSINILKRMFLEDLHSNLSVLRPEARVSAAVSGERKFLGWNVPPDELEFIPEHWLTQYEPEKSMHYMLSLFYIFFMFFSIIGNGLVIWIFLTSKPLRTPSNCFVINLAIFDFIMMCKAPIFIYNSINGGFALGNVGCQLFASVGSYSGIGQGMTNAWIGYDRYHVIAKPMGGQLTFTKAILINGLIWMYCTPWVLLPLFRIWGRFVPGTYVFFTVTLLNVLS